MTNKELAKIIHDIAGSVESGSFGDHPAFLLYHHHMPLTGHATGDMVVDARKTGQTFVVSSLPGIPGVDQAIRNLDPKPGR